jgi:acyl transferase domain-containing protein/NAD(P)-dependent dehydrogenase (short-subunit alcohol dehydrogenase family)/acyl-CoA thioesterase FadM
MKARAEVTAMKFFAHRYQIHFSDTMAYGTHHFLTNFQFQCAAREALLFLAEADGSEPWRADIAAVELVTQQGYTYNLSPLGLGDWALVAMTADELGHASFQLCFRVLSSSGAPVACGYQNIVVLDRQARRVQRVPPLIAQRLQPIAELLPGFAEQARRAGARAKQLFPEALSRCARELLSRQPAPQACSVVSLSGLESDPSRGDDAAREPASPAAATSRSAATPARAVRASTDAPLALVCGGQGSLDPEWTWQLASASRTARRTLDAAQELCRQRWACDYVAWLKNPAGSATDAPEQIAREQLTLYLGALCAGRALLEILPAPAWVLGHSFGEITAAVLGGMLEDVEGLRVVAARTSALLGLRERGGLLVVRAAEPELARLEREFPELQLAVRNHANQVLLAGARETLARCAAFATSQGIATSLLSGFAFHSPLVFDAAARFRSAIAGLRLMPGSLPVFSPAERRALRAEDDCGGLWASQLVRSLDFAAGMSRLLADGDYRFVVCARSTGLSRVLETLLAGRSSSVARAPALLARAPEKAGPEPFTSAARGEAKARREQEPLAIVAVGCRLPGAANFSEYVRLLAAGTCAIADLGSSELAADFSAPGPVTPDKTYTGLRGFVRDAESVVNGSTAARDASKIVRLARAALEECRAGVAPSRSDAPARIGVVIGSTADGCGEYDEALVLERLRAAASTPPALARAIERELAALGRSAELEPHAALRRLARETFGAEATSLCVDAACASSLYALDIAARWLYGGHERLVFAGGAFAPGWSNSCLFAQFNGLSRSGSLPLDARADGVVFGEGAAFVALRRLSDALEHGDRIWGVLRGIGLSSDGHSASPSAPRAGGQVLALERAYTASGVDPRTVQYVEAHATGTPVGDATELEALHGFFSARGAAPGSIRVGSVKSQISHVGWAAGVASLAKVLAALHARELPAQHNFERTNPRVELGASPLHIVGHVSPWPENRRSGLDAGADLEVTGGEPEPRRAAVNGFGFGGTNSHVIVDAFLEHHHRALCEAREPRLPAAMCRVARACARQDDTLPWPANARRLLPDVLDTMDGSQRLCVSLAARCLETLGERSSDHRQRIGVLVAMAGKTETILSANDRIYGQHLLRTLSRDASLEDAAAITRAVEDFTARRAPSNPYTLTGGMPNLAPGRVCQVFDLAGPNLVLDAGDESLAHAEAYACELVAGGACDFVLVIGLTRAATGIWEGDARLSCARELALQRGLAEISLESAPGSVPSPERADVSPEPAAMQSAPGSVPSPERADVSPEPAAMLSLEGDLAGAPPVEAYVPALVALHLPELKGSGDGEPLLIFGSDTVLAAERVRALEGQRRLLVSRDARELDARLARGERLRGVLLSDLRGEPYALLEPGMRREREGLEPLFEFCRRHYVALAEGQLALASVCLNAWAGPDLPRPETGLLGGFVKALCRELPTAQLVQVHADEDLASALDVAERAWQTPELARELFVSGGQTRAYALAKLSEWADGVPLLDADSVVVVTAGARGISAELAAWLLGRFACRLVLIGRSDPERVGPRWRQLSPAELDDSADAHYREALSQGLSLREARRAFLELRSAHEVLVNLQRLARLPGSVSYQRCDLTQPDQVRACVRDIAARYGRVDAVIHGAGLQVSSALPKKSPEAFWGVIDSKLLGLRHLLAALDSEFPDKPPHVHVATSAFSYFGNDGQPDYGAVNEALNRLAQCVQQSAHTQRFRGEAPANRFAARPSWSTLAWLAWDNIGMTRGSEYQSLARARQMRAISADEGRALFGRLFAGRPRHGAVILASEHELRRYAPTCTMSEASAVAAPDIGPGSETRWTVSIERAPYLAEHRLRGCPLVPACVLLDRMLQHARERFRDLPIWTLEGCEFLHALRVPFERERELTVRSSAGTTRSGGVELEVWVEADVAAPDGRLLEAGRRHARCRVVLGRAPAVAALPFPAAPRVNLVGATWLAADPYTDAASPLELGPGFDCLRNLRLSACGNSARFQPVASGTPTAPALALPALLVDALLRVAVIHATEGELVSVCVPTFIERVAPARQLAPGAERREFQLASAAPRVAEDRVECDWAAASTSADEPALALFGVRGKLVAHIPARQVSHDRHALDRLAVHT